MLTMPCDAENDNPSLSWEKDEKSELISIDLLPKCIDSKLQLFPSVSELQDSRGLDIPVSEWLLLLLLYNEGNKGSVLGLLELTKLMSESGTEISPYDLSYIPLLVNGDLLPIPFCFQMMENLLLENYARCKMKVAIA